VMQQILEETSEGVRDLVIREHALKNLYGFEYLIAPYTIAHLKLSQFLQDKKYTMQPKERLQIYLTNTLEPIEPQPNFFLPALSNEVKLAQEVKDKKILVITGNPPYKGHSLNPSYREIVLKTKTGKIKTKKVPTFIGALIQTYKWVDGHPLGEKNPKWLQDDYVKFIRFAQWKMDQVEEGIVGIITNHSFLDNPTFRGMRQSLMQTYNRIYLLDLHGNTEKKETAPDGGKDVNVFEIKQGVCISIFVRQPGLERKIFHADLWGKRADKYRACLEMDLNALEWQELSPSSPFYLFIPQDIEQRTQYEKGWKITQIFLINSVGIVTARDDLTICFTPEEVRRTIHDFSALPLEEARRKYHLGKDVRDWKVKLAQEDLRNSGLVDDKIVPVAYRPFDKRHTYYTGNSRGFHCMPRREVMRHMFNQKMNIGIMTTRLTKDDWSILATEHIIGHKAVSRYDIGYLFPLYLYNIPNDKKPKASLLDLVDPFDGKDRIENFAPEWRSCIDDKYDHHYEPEAILGYIYAVLHSPTYRRQYAEFLKIDFPRIPFVDDRQTFEKLSALGWQLVQAHLLKEIPATPQVEITKGSDLVEKPGYRAPEQRLYINPQQYFAPVPEDVWNFNIGGYQVLDKYLKSRKGRRLSLDEIENVMNVVKVLRFTIDQMQKIDATWQP
jgi:predicted helicase